MDDTHVGFVADRTFQSRHYEWMRLMFGSGKQQPKAVQKLIKDATARADKKIAKAKSPAEIKKFRKELTVEVGDIASRQQRKDIEEQKRLTQQMQRENEANRQKQLDWLARQQRKGK